MKPQRTPNSQKILRKNNNAEAIILSNSHSITNVATVMKTVYYWHLKQTYRSMEQRRHCRNKTILIKSIDLEQRTK